MIVVLVILGITIFFIINFLTCYKKKVLLGDERKYYYYIIFLLNIIVYSFIVRNKTIYFWDYGGYWMVSEAFSESMLMHPFSNLRDLYVSILNSEYNLLPSLFLVLPIKVLGNSYLSYTLSVLNVFIVPTIIFLISILISIDESENKFMILVLILSIPAILNPVLLGYLDSIGLVFITMICLMLVNKKIENFTKKDILTISFLLLILILVRRWYLFWYVTFFITYFIVIIIEYLYTKNKDLKNYFKVMRNLFFIGILTNIILLIFFYHFYERLIFNHYSNMYSAYKTLNFKSTLLRDIGYFSIPLFLFSILSLFYKCKSTLERRFLNFLFLQIIIIVVLFYRIQNMGIHHYYLLTIQVIVLSSMGILFLIKKFKKIKIIIILLLLMNFLNSFYLDFKKNKIVEILVSNFHQRPIIRNDIDKIHLLINKANEITSENGQVYVLSSSVTLNDDIIFRAYYPENKAAFRNFLITNHIDKRDGFPENFFKADIIIVGSPFQYHLNPKDQQVVGVLVSELLNKESRIGKKFKLIESYQLDNNVKAILYKKISPLTIEDKKYISNLLKVLYPNDPFIYKGDNKYDEE